MNGHGRRVHHVATRWPPARHPSAVVAVHGGCVLVLFAMLGLAGLVLLAGAAALVVSVVSPSPMSYLDREDAPELGELWAAALSLEPDAIVPGAATLRVEEGDTLGERHRAA